MKDLKTCREEIDAIDKEIIALFEKRMHVAKDVIIYKLAHDMQIFQKDREKEVIQKNVDRLEDKSLESYAKTFVQDTMNLSKSYQSTFIPLKKYEATELKENFKVGYQGVPGSFSNQALNCWFGDIEGINYPHFEDVYQALEKGEIDYGVLPLENSSTGAINDNYDLLTQYGFYIVGEQSITIDQNLLGIKGATLEDIKDVYSHVQGLKQTSEFLNAHHIEGHDYLNTAAAAKYISEAQDKHIGAIASSEAAKLYNLDIIAKAIQNDQSNHTRFIIIARQYEIRPSANRISMVFTVNHEVGALYEVMRVVKEHNINMARIESRPLPLSPWEYYFYLDIDGNLNQDHVQRALQEIKTYTNTFRMIGNYERKES